MSKNSTIKLLVFLIVIILTDNSFSQNIYLFADPVYYDTDIGSIQSAALDVNGDNYPDLIVLNYANVSVRMNNGNGTFQSQTMYPVQSHSFSMKIADFNNDSSPDIAVTCSDANVVSYLQNNGDGTFQYFINSPTQSGPHGIDAYDFNGDNYLDIALVNNESSTVQILINNQDGTFTSDFSAPTGAGPAFITVGDLNEDSYPELVITRNFVNYIFNIGVLTVFKNNGNGTFTKYIDNQFGSGANNIYIYDFNGDSHNDIITNLLRNNHYSMCFFINDGQGNFGDPLTTFAGYSGGFTMADFDLNGYMDFAVSEHQYNASGLAIVLNNGSFNFEPVWSFYVGDQPRLPASADFDMDGDIDIAVPIYDEGKVAVVMNTLDPVPVELTYFTAVVSGNEVTLSWQTASETNNSGFEIQRRKKEVGSRNSEWVKIGFVKGNGTTTQKNDYSFIDNGIKTGVYSYKLVQIDFDGTRTESEEVNIEANSQPAEFALMQNYPNPFNPSTTIEYSIPTAGNVTLNIYNELGEEVYTLVNGYKQAGNYKVSFNAEHLATGIYFYKIYAGNWSSARKMVLLK
jgi:hypothetical protein